MKTRSFFYRLVARALVMSAVSSLTLTIIAQTQRQATPKPGTVTAVSRSTEQTTPSKGAAMNRTTTAIALPLEVDDSSTTWTRVRIDFPKDAPLVVLVQLDAPLYEAETPGLSVTQGVGDLLLWSDGAELVIGEYIPTLQRSQLAANSDKVVAGPGGTIRPIMTRGAVLANNKLGAFIFESDPKFPLTFRVVRGQGMVYLCGRGHVTGPGIDQRLGEQFATTEWSSILLKGRAALAREGAAQAMGWLKEAKWVPSLIEAMNNPVEDVAVRRSAIEGAGRIRDVRAIPSLEKLVSDKDSHLSAIAKWSLQEINTALSDEIHDAAKSGNLEKVKSLLKDNPALVFSKDKEGQTLLLLAAQEGHKQLVELLLANKPEVNLRNKWGFTALHNAAARGHRDIAELLLNDKAEVNARVNLSDAPSAQAQPLAVAQLFRQMKGATALHLAALAGHKEVAEILLAHEADVNARNQEGATPLHLAALGGQRGVADSLLTHGADVNAKNNEGKHSLGMAVVAEALLEGATPLQWAAARGHKDLAELLLERGAIVNAQNGTGYTPLFAAVFSGDLKMVALLLEKGADVNAKAGAFTAAEYASVLGYTGIEQLLRQHGGHE